MFLSNVSSHHQALVVLIASIVGCGMGVWTVLSHVIYSPSAFLSANDNTWIEQHLVATPPHDLFPREPIPRPPLNSIVQGWNITGDASWLLNFAIIGFPKCGTTTLMDYFALSDEIQIFPKERCEIGYNQQVRLIEDLYQGLPPGDYVRGLKCPRDLEQTTPSIRNYIQFFPRTDFFVGIRHPVLWFESFYNFRVHNGFPMVPADQLIGKCKRRNKGLCTYRGNFHLHLANLGMTNVSDPNEYRLVHRYLRGDLRTDVAFEGRVFLYEVSQLNDSNATRAQQLRTDLAAFLHLRRPLPPMIWVKPGVQHDNPQHHQAVNAKKIDICDSRYDNVRGVLMDQGRQASKWIRKFFLQSPRVVVSSPLHFRSLLKAWERDPCLDRHTPNTTTN